MARLPGLPRFGGGAVGYLAYELARKFEPRIPLAPNDPLGLPLAHLMMVDTLLVFDHLRRTIKAVTYVPLTDDLPTDYRRGCERLDALLERLRGGPHAVGLEDAPGRARPEGIVSNTTQAEYEDTSAARQGVHRRRRVFPDRPVAAPFGADNGQPRRPVPRAAIDQSQSRTCTSSTSATTRSSAPRPSCWCWSRTAS